MSSCVWNHHHHPRRCLLMTVFPGKSGPATFLGSFVSTCFGRGPLWIAGTMLFMGRMSFLSPNQQCHSLKEIESISLTGDLASLFFFSITWLLTKAALVPSRKYAGFVTSVTRSYLLNLKQVQVARCHSKNGPVCIVLASLLQRRRSTEVNQTLHDVWPSPGLVGLHYVYIFGSSYPLTEFCYLQNSLCVQVLRSPILAALLHGTPAAGVSQTLRCGTGRRCQLYLAGRRSRRAPAHISSMRYKLVPFMRFQLIWRVPDLSSMFLFWMNEVCWVRFHF